MSITETLYHHYLNHPVICTDTRKITSGCLFFALKGEKFDANAFAQQAILSGAAFAIVDQQQYVLNDQCILVDDVLTALQDLAKMHRAQLAIPVIGLTGSNGKTTTKELIQAILATHYRSFATYGNLNNHIGVPLSILAIGPEVEIAVIEMGANHQKEIEFLCSIAQPTHGLITNVGMAHLDGFGGFEGVKKGKAELYTYLKETQGYAFIYRDSPELEAMSITVGLEKVIYYGKGKENSIYGHLLQSDPFIELQWANETESFVAKANLTGSYNFENILAAICIGHFFGIKPGDINRGLAQYFPNNNRSQLTQTAHNTVICDFYNANPSSMAAALKNLSTLSAKHKTAIIADMFELGAAAADQHEEIIKLAQMSDLNERIFIGLNFYAWKDLYQGNFFSTPLEAKAYLAAKPIKESLILLKGSRGMALEQLLPLL